MSREREVFQLFAELFEANRDPEGPAAQSRYSNILYLSAAISEIALGRTIAVEEIKRADDGRSEQHERERPIQRFGMFNEMSLLPTGEIKPRTYPGSKHQWIPNDFFGHSKKAKGEVVGIDVNNSSLVIRPDNLRDRLSLGW